MPLVIRAFGRCHSRVSSLFPSPQGHTSRLLTRSEAQFGKLRFFGTGLSGMKKESDFRVTLIDPSKQAISLHCETQNQNKRARDGILYRGRRKKKKVAAHFSSRQSSRDLSAAVQRRRKRERESSSDVSRFLRCIRSIRTARRGTFSQAALSFSPKQKCTSSSLCTAADRRS